MFILRWQQEAPYMMFKQHDDALFLAGNERFEGYLADLLFRLSLAIGFDYEIRLSVDSTYGRSGHNGSWTGMVGEVQRGVGKRAWERGLERGICRRAWWGRSREG